MADNNINKPKQKQKVIRIGEGRTILKTTMSVLGRFVRPIDVDDMMLWLQMRELNSPIKGLSSFWGPDTSSYLVLDDRSAIPISPYRDKIIDNDTLAMMVDTDRIAQYACTYHEMHSDAEKRKLKFADNLSIAIMGIVTMVLILAGIYVLRNVNIGEVIR